jgi:HAD superfamily hydrolase (TIGR01484 family)
MKYKMIALDLDGTLNNDNRTITQRTKDALIAVQKQGVTVVLASGRQSPGLKRESETLELEKHHGILLSYNGGKIIDATTKEVIYEKSIPGDIAKRLLRHLEKMPVTPIVDDGEYIYTTDKDGYRIWEESRNNLEIKMVNNIADEIDFCPVKVTEYGYLRVFADIFG